MIPLLPDKYYHIYNHANGHDDIFCNDRNYRFFLKKYKQHIAPIADTLAYCLMPNHFHLLVRMKEIETICLDLSFSKGSSFPKFQTLEKVKENEKLSSDEISLFYSKQFANFFSSYTQAFNLYQNRKGSLFQKNFKRKEITSSDYFIKLVNYIHFNPVVAGLVEKVDEWMYSSYNAIVSNKDTMVARDEIIAWFDGIDNFIYNHRFPFDFEL